MDQFRQKVSFLITSMSQMKKITFGDSIYSNLNIWLMGNIVCVGNFGFSLKLKESSILVPELFTLVNIDKY